MLFIFVGWYLLGILGVAFVWWRIQKDEGALSYCPSPVAIIYGSIIAIFGPLVLVWALVTLLTVWLQQIDNWFTRPICKPKR
jgi:hypothetical protein